MPKAQPVEERVAEPAVGVDPGAEGGEVVPPGVPTSHLVTREGEDLAPVGPCRGRQGGLDLGKQRPHGGFVAPPGEVDADDIDTVGGAQPQVVGPHCAHLADLQQRGDAIGQPAHGLQRGDGLGARDEVLRLQLLPEPTA